jgi:hypothetical protein
MWCYRRALACLRGGLLLLVLLSCASVARADRLVTVALDVGQVGDRDFRELDLLTLQRKLVLRLTQGGFAVVAPEGAPQLRLVLRVQAGELEIETRIGDEVVARRRVARIGDVASYHLEVIHKAVEATRQAREQLPPPPASAPASQPASAPASAPVVVRPPPPPPPPPPVVQPRWWHVELSGGVGPLYRIQGVDPMIRAGARLGGQRFALRGSLMVSPSIQRELWVVEWSLQGGGSIRFPLGYSLHLELALLVGVLNHAYGIDRGDPASGSRWDFLGTVPLELGWRATSWLGFRLWLAPGITEGARDHRLDGEVIWERSFFRLEAGVSVVLVLQ